MVHTDKGKYFKKHDQSIEVDEDLKNEIIEQAKNKGISCKKAEEIAGELGCSLEETGRTIDILNIKITKCQLGLFGYGETKNRSTVKRSYTRCERKDHIIIERREPLLCDCLENCFRIKYSTHESLCRLRSFGNKG
jgi:hypothetical protein